MPKILAPEDFGWVSREFSLLWGWIADPYDIVIDEDNARHSQATHPFPVRIAIAIQNKYNVASCKISLNKNYLKLPDVAIHSAGKYFHSVFFRVVE
ncbi:hypothetical protein VP1G_10750 [Cytospora mali]|uniref:Uncharacterized protein n=1 Tax=Cytospora mali TaxID=578113 RepID=A0A194UU42_CYTMA|nr:hypothetical protein VP1G_10750 [Valsa mali var. pyri (nom. inval.)]